MDYDQYSDLDNLSNALSIGLHSESARFVQFVPSIFHITTLHTEASLPRQLSNYQNSFVCQVWSASAYGKLFYRDPERVQLLGPNLGGFVAFDLVLGPSQHALRGW